MSKVVIIDYGMGNLFSVRRAFEVVGAEVLVTSDPVEILQGERVVLPGVGAFKDGMQGLRQRGLIEPIRDYARIGRPFLGICLGMQMMLEVGEEFGVHDGLGLIPGRVKKISNKSVEGGVLKVPHIGWNELNPSASHRSWNGTPLHGIEPGSAVYFVHSFAAEPQNPDHALATTDYGGHPLVAVVGSGSLYGCQFHPERSGSLGLKMIQNFVLQLGAEKG